MAASGEVWLVDLGMSAKVRPALILSVPPTDADGHDYPAHSWRNRDFCVCLVGASAALVTVRGLTPPGPIAMARVRVGA